MEYKGIKVDKNNDPRNWAKRVLIFTPSRGSVRMEWVQARYGQITPCNWSMVELRQTVSDYIPIEYQLADAQNLMAKIVIRDDYDWIIYIEDDNVIPPDFLIKMNQYMLKATEPVVSGVYFTKSVPPEPLIYRGRGNSYFTDWKMGDKVRCDGIPFGARLEHASLIKEAWKTSPEYVIGNEVTRRVFEQPTDRWYDEEKGGFAGRTGTTDLAWCTRIMEEGLLKKIGYPNLQKKKYPFLCDTSIFVKHIDPSGRMWPLEIPQEYVRKQPTRKQTP